MKCPNCRNEIHNSALKCPWCNYVIGDQDRGYATEPVYGNNQYDPYYNNRSAGYPPYGGYNNGGYNNGGYNNGGYNNGGYNNGGYDQGGYNNGVDYQDNNSYYYEQKPKTDYGQLILPITIFILGLQLVILMLHIIVILQL